MRFLFLLLLVSYTFLPITAQNPLATLEKYSPTLAQILEQAETYEIQILYTQVDRNNTGNPILTTYQRGLDSFRYFYPASTIKMPLAFLSLERIHELRIEGLTRHSPMQHIAARSIQTGDFLAPESKSGFQSVDQYVKEIFLVSDNNASNRLYEWLGQEEIDIRLKAKGFSQSKIIHRLGRPGYDSVENSYTNPVRFYSEEGSILYHKGLVQSMANTSALDQKLKGTVKGKGYYDDQSQSVIYEPFDFSQKNFISLADLHQMLIRFIFPQIVSLEHRFQLATEDYEAALRYMGMRPRESTYPSYDSLAYPDSYVKFFMFGTDSTRIPDHIRIFNKVGWAYGYLTDVAYIVDLKHGIDFFISATIHVNENQIYNDGIYEYESVGLPFFRELGNALYEYERQRPRKGEAPVDQWQSLFE